MRLGDLHLGKALQWCQDRECDGCPAAETDDGCGIGCPKLCWTVPDRLQESIKLGEMRDACDNMDCLLCILAGANCMLNVPCCWSEAALSSTWEEDGP